MNETAAIFLTLGLVLGLARIARAGAHLLHVPQVSILMLAGLLSGPMAFDLVPASVRTTLYPTVAEATLAMVGFLLGGELSWRTLTERGRAVLSVSIIDTLLTFAMVGAGLWFLGLPWPAAAVLGCAAVATDPAAVQSVIKEGRADGPISTTLLGVVAIDDLWGILLFSVVIAFIPGAGEGGLWAGATESVGSIAAGATLGGVMALLTGKLDRGRPTLEEALAFVFVAIGLAETLDLSYLLTAVSMGAAVSNLATSHEHTFREIEGIEWPFLVVFFVLSGASMEPAGLGGSAMVAVGAYVALRTCARVVAGWTGSRLGGLGPRAGILGLGLLPQAGVALGLVLVVAERIPEVGDLALPVVILGTVVFEVVGPVATRAVLQYMGETGSGEP